jgi:1-acyl-sn-glycerol-3-phosphate acyltransferase
MRAAGFVEVDRQNRESAIRSLARAKDALAHGTSIWIAPEGTRSRTGELAPFKQGGFHLALDAGCRILPITIVGTRNVLRAKGFNVRPGALVHVWVNEPVDPAEYGHERRAELCEEVRRRITTRMPDYARGALS